MQDSFRSYACLADDVHAGRYAYAVNTICVPV
jgi:hypothetical protein